jgi:hypothetical protein
MSSIRPTQPGQTPQSGPGTLKGTGGAAPVRPDEKTAEPKPAGAPNDSVQLSQAVRELQERLGLEAIPTGTLSPERLKEIVARVSGGHYDRPEVLDELARKLASELGPEQG